jgi:hypothetical protein
MLPAGVTEAGGLPGRREVAGGVKGIACQPPMMDPPDGMFTVTPPLPPFALIAVPNSPWVDHVARSDLHRPGDRGWWKSPRNCIAQRATVGEYTDCVGTVCHDPPRRHSR